MAIPRFLTPAERAALEEFVARVRELLGDDLVEVRLFGSRARGEGHESSDLDVALVVRPGGREQRRAVYDLAYDVGFPHGVDLAPLVIEEERLAALRARERLLARDLDREGIPL